LARHLQIEGDPDQIYDFDADAVPDPAYHVDADPNPPFNFIRIHADPDPRHYFLLNRISSKKNQTE
jgi:hypothetical protein